MKLKFTLAVVLLAGLLGAARDAKCDVTLTLSEGLTFDAKDRQTGLIRFCNDPRCTSQTAFYDYKAEGSKIIVPLHGRKRLKVTFKGPDQIVYQWTSDVVDGKEYTITIGESENVVAEQIVALQKQIDELQKQPKEVREEFEWGPYSLEELQRRLDWLSKQPH